MRCWCFRCRCCLPSNHEHQSGILLRTKGRRSNFHHLRFLTSSRIGSNRKLSEGSHEEPRSPVRYYQILVQRAVPHSSECLRHCTKPSSNRRLPSLRTLPGHTEVCLMDALSTYC